MAKASGELTQDLRGMPADLSMLYDPCPGILRAAVYFAGGGNMQGSVKRGEVKFIEKNDDIGGGRTGKPSSKQLVRDEAERLLKHGYAGSKKALASDLSAWLARHHQDEPQMKPAVVERNITDIWQMYRGG